MADRSSPSKLRSSRYHPTSFTTSASSSTPNSSSIAKQIENLQAILNQVKKDEARASQQQPQRASSSSSAATASSAKLEAISAEIAEIEGKLEETRVQYDYIRNNWRLIEPELQAQATEDANKLAKSHGTLTNIVKRLKEEQIQLIEDAKYKPKASPKKVTQEDIAASINSQLRRAAMAGGSRTLSSYNAIPAELLRRHPPPTHPSERRVDQAFDYTAELQEPDTSRKPAYHVFPTLKPAALASAPKPLAPSTAVKIEAHALSKPTAIDDFDGNYWKIAAPGAAAPPSPLRVAPTSRLGDTIQDSTEVFDDMWYALAGGPLDDQKSRKKKPSTKPAANPLDEEISRRSRRLANIAPEPLPLPNSRRRSSKKSNELDVSSAGSLPPVLDHSSSHTAGLAPLPSVSQPPPLDLYETHPTEVDTEEPPLSSSENHEDSSTASSNSEVLVSTADAA